MKYKRLKTILLFFSALLGAGFDCSAGEAAGTPAPAHVLAGAEPQQQASPGPHPLAGGKPQLWAAGRVVQGGVLLIVLQVPPQDIAAWAGLRAELVRDGSSATGRGPGALFFPVALGGWGMALAALAGVPSDQAPGTYGVWLTVAGLRVPAQCQVEVTARRFVSETIPLHESNTTLRASPNPERDRQARQLSALTATADPAAVFLTGPIVLPVSAQSRQSSFYGDRRVYVYSNGIKATSVHAGVDFAVPVGTVVRACGAGRVVFSDFRILTGHTIVIAHLPGVYSLYYHLQRRDVQPGDAVWAGAPIAASGDTGLATGPHLHWEIRAGGHAVDPWLLMERPVLDKGLILAMMD